MLELTENLRRFYMQVTFIALVVLTVLIVYWQDLSILANEAFQNEAVSHIFLVPALVSFLVYRKREIVKAALAVESLGSRTESISSSETAGIVLCLSAFLLYWYGSFTFYALEYHIISLVVFLVGATLALFNIKVLTALAFPILFLIFLMPPPSNFTLTAGAALGHFNAQASYTLLKTLGVPVALSSEYGSPTITVNIPSDQPLTFAVDLSCSGIYSLIAFTMFAAFLVYLVRGSVRKRMMLIPLSFLALPILNTLRISIILFIAHQFGEQIAMTIFHTFSGWILLLFGTILLLLVAEKLLHLRILEHEDKITSCPECDDALKRNASFCQQCGQFTGAHQFKPDNRLWAKTIGLLLVSCIMVWTVQAPVLAFAPGLSLTTGNLTASVDVFPRISDYHPVVFFERDQAFEKISGADASLHYVYFSRNNSTPDVHVHVGVDSSQSNLHSWEGCLVTWQIAQGYDPLVDVLEFRDIQILQDPPIIAKYFMFQYPPDYPTFANRTQVTLYWYLRAPFKTGTTIESKFVRISLIVYPESPSDSQELQHKMLSIGQSIAAFWEPLKAQAAVSLGIPAIQILLGLTLLFGIVVQTTQYAKEVRRKATNLKIFDQLASPEEKLVYQTIQGLARKTKHITTQKIGSALEKSLGKSHEPTELVDMLSGLEGQGILRADITIIQDQPRFVWKP